MAGASLAMVAIGAGLILDLHGAIQPSCCHEDDVVLGAALVLLASLSLLFWTH